jgi:adenylate cyclase
LDPHYPDLFLHFLGHASFVSGRYEDAVAAFRRRLQRQPKSDITHVLLAASLGQLGFAAEAKEAWQEALRVNPNYSLEQKRKIMPYSDEGEFDRIVSGLQQAGIQL